MSNPIGERVRQRRIELGLSQAELGEMVGTRQEGVSLFENRGPKNIDLISKLAEALDCEAAWLAFDVGPKKRREL